MLQNKQQWAHHIKLTSLWCGFDITDVNLISLSRAAGQLLQAGLDLLLVNGGECKTEISGDVCGNIFKLVYLHTDSLSKLR